MIQPTTHEFKTEVKQILNLIVNSLYSNKEIFLRELISNASDAINKISYKSQTETDILGDDTEFKIKIIPNKEKNTLEISDNGIGMTYEELMENIGTIAKSGTGAFMQALEKAKNNNFIAPELIGRFGVGFYSAFMVSEKVVIITKAAGSDKAFEWESSGDGSYTIKETEKEKRGASIILHLSKTEDGQDFTDEWVLRSIIKKHSDFVSYPIVMDVEKEKPVKNPVLDKEGKPIEGQTEKVIEEETLNSMKAIWAKNKKDVSDEEYTEFYKHIGRDWNPPLSHLHLKLEGATEYTALLYIPSKAPFDMFAPERKHGIQLYCKRVFIMDDCKDLMPEYLRFIKGVVDAPDLDLNISREILQQNLLIKNIKTNLVKKLIELLSSMDKEKYEKFYKEFGNVLKEGIHTDWENKDKIAELIRYKTTKSDDKLVSLKDYVSNMQKDQKDIYYITGESVSSLINSPYLEKLKEKEYEILLMTDPIDEWVVQSLTEYDKKPLKSAEKGDTDTTDEDKKKKDDYTELFEAIKTNLDDKIREVKASGRLKDSITCLSGDSYDMSAYMEKILKASGQNIPEAKRILELNINHPAIEKINEIYKKDKNNEKIKDFSLLFYDIAVIGEGGKVENPSRLNKMVGELLSAKLTL